MLYWAVYPVRKDRGNPQLVATFKYGGRSY
jgi:hypothetical protein